MSIEAEFKDISPANTSPKNMKSYFVILSGQAVSLLGSQIVAFAIIW